MGKTIVSVNWGTTDPTPLPVLSPVMLGNGGVSVAPGGRFFLGSTDAATRVIDRNGRLLNTLSANDQFIWSSDGNRLCRLRSTPSGLKASVLSAPDFQPSETEVSVPAGHGGTLMLQGCDVTTDRILLTENASFASVSASDLVNLRTGQLIHRASYPSGTVLHQSADLSLVAANCAVPNCTSELFESTTGRSLVRLIGRQIRAVSADNRFLLTLDVPPLDVHITPFLHVDVRSIDTGSIAWSSTGHFQGAIPGPKGTGFAVGLGPSGDAIDYDILYVDERGTATVIAHKGALV